MATFTKEDAEKFYLQHRRNLAMILTRLEDTIIEGRDTKAIPVYLTKQRIKSVDSLYLKAKRKTFASLDKVTDMAGLRVLCLFAQDILEVHKYLVAVLCDGYYNLTEFEIYNWPDDNYIKELKQVVQNSFPTHELKAAKKGSGYKSIHYVVTQTYGGVSYPIEIQLRTLLQDVWGELEHSLAYKQGNIHPHIRQSFQLLSLDLENTDTSMAHLRNIRDREHSIGLFARKEGGPSPPLDYEEHWLPQKFTTQETAIGKAVQKYTAYMGIERDYLNLRGWAGKALELHDEIEQLLEPKDIKQGNVQHWLLMERAYVLFVLSKYDEVEELYTEAKRKWKERYMSYFRLEELHFLKGEIVNALELFDNCERILLELDKDNKVAPLTYIQLEARIAKTYWLLGEQYYDVALRKMQKAEEIYKAHDENISTGTRLRLDRTMANNLCWYYLEIYILAKERYEQGRDMKDVETADRAYKEASKRYNDLETLMNKLEDKRANNYDTAAWFCYHTFLRDKETNGALLDKAKQYCRDGRGLKILAPHIIHSSYLYRRHTQDILSA